ncbi:uncharacterized protein [Rhodnius prolixus]|uniref:uncharacterized protein n=1 Tax=Rhodnius prolixus TaxID=13249 RepID=UPI003D18B4FA
MESHLNNEELCQEVYELKRALDRSELISRNLQQDIETLQNHLSDSETKFEEYKKRVEGELTNKWSEKVNLLRTELDDERENAAAVISELTKKISELENRDVTILDDSINGNNKDQLHKIQDEYEMLIHQLDEMNLLLQSSEQEKIQLSTKIKTLEEEHQETLQILEIKKEALTQTTEALKDIQEEKAILANELATLKAGPLDDQRRGNSLFAEVEDNRQKLLKNIALLKNKLRESKVLLSNKTSEISQLQNEIDLLHRRIQDANRVIQPGQIKLVEGFKERINDLELVVIRKLEKIDSTQKIPANEFQRLQWALSSLEKTRTEHCDLLQDFNKLSQQRLLDTEALTAAQQEINCLKTEISSLKSKYQLKLQECPDKHDSEKTKNVEDLNSYLRNDEVGYSDKQQLKVVRFAEDR